MVEERSTPLSEAAPPPGTTALASNANADFEPDRRRPGRQLYPNPWLIALLRNPYGTEARHDDLKPAKGVLIGLLLVIPFWAAVGVLVWRYLLR